MDTVSKERRRAANDVQNALREVNGHLTVLNQQISSRVALRDVDRGCLDLIARFGPIGPSALAKRAGLHPATMTGVLDRLERDGWIVRERDQTDRRAVVVRVLPARGGELFRLYGGMRGELDDICADYDLTQLELIAGFLNRVAAAGERSAEALAQE